jgi:pimeloyl-ACP methyl ester carboxylesterase
MSKNKIYCRSLYAIFLAMLLCSCGHFSPQPTLPEDILLYKHEFKFKDQGTAEYFILQKFLSGFDPAMAEEPILMFVVPGSGCASMQDFLPEYFRGLEGESGALKIFILQKRYISSTPKGRFWGAQRTDGGLCSSDFISNDHLSRWLVDQDEFIRHMLELQGASKTKGQRLAIMGISEGAEVAPLLARTIPGVTHLALLGNGGMQPMEAFRLLADKQRVSRSLVADQVQQASLLDELDRVEKIEAHIPDYSMLNGRSVLYWRELSQLKHTENLLALTIPIFMAMGEADQAVPAESALWIKNKFSQGNKTNLHMVLFPLADHGLYSPNGFYLPDFMHQLDLWLGSN